METLASSFCGKRLVEDNPQDKQVTLLTTKHLTSQTPNFITIYIDNEVWSKEQKLVNNALPCVENHSYNVLPRAVYNNTMKKQYSYSQVV